MGILGWIGFVVLAILVSFFIWYIRRFFGIYNFEKYKNELRQLSDEELIERKRAMDTLVALRNDVHLTLAIRSSFLQEEVNRRRIGLCDGKKNH